MELNNHAFNIDFNLSDRTGIPRSGCTSAVRSPFPPCHVSNWRCPLFHWGPNLQLKRTPASKRAAPVASIQPHLAKRFGWCRLTCFLPGMTGKCANANSLIEHWRRLLFRVPVVPPPNRKFRLAGGRRVIWITRETSP